MNDVMAQALYVCDTPHPVLRPSQCARYCQIVGHPSLSMDEGNYYDGDWYGPLTPPEYGQQQGNTYQATNTSGKYIANGQLVTSDDIDPVHSQWAQAIVDEHEYRRRHCSE